MLGCRTKGSEAREEYLPVEKTKRCTLCSRLSRSLVQGTPVPVGQEGWKGSYGPDGRAQTSVNEHWSYARALSEIKFVEDTGKEAAKANKDVRDDDTGRYVSPILKPGVRHIGDMNQDTSLRSALQDLIDRNTGKGHKERTSI